MMNEQYPFSQFVGVDVSQATLVFAFAAGQQTFSCKNTAEEIVSQLIALIKEPQSTIVVMEATGGV